MWSPTERLLVERAAVPVVVLRGTAPRVVFPSEKVTVPVGVPLAVETVAVKVTASPKVEGALEEVTVVVVVALLTVWVREMLMLLAKASSPP